MASVDTSVRGPAGGGIVHQTLSTDIWHPETYNTIGSCVYSKESTSPVLELLKVQPGERILDLGCGSGELTLELARLVGSDGIVIGIDASTNMIEKARENGVAASFVYDAQALQLPPPSPIYEELAAVLPKSFDYKFDAVFSNMALHWCKKDPHAVARGVASALRKGGRFVGEMGGFKCIDGVRTVIHTVMRRRGFNVDSIDPWYFPTEEQYRNVLESAGFRVAHISINNRLSELKTDLVDWQRVFCRESFYASLNDAEAEEVMNEVQEMCAVDRRDASGKWTSISCRLRFIAIKD